MIKDGDKPSDVSDKRECTGYVACEFFEDLKAGDTFRLLGELFAKLGPSVAVKIEGWYTFNENTNEIHKDT